MAQAEIVIEKADTSRYTYDGDDAVEQAIHAHQELIGGAVAELLDAKTFCAVVLIGGYGRGEGGFCYIDGQPAPYNDYDYFVVIKGASKQETREISKQLSVLAHQLEEQVGVEVDFYPMHLEEIPKLEFSLMFAEMQWGHRVVAGDQGVLNAMPFMPFNKLALSEFTRLMLNRGSLLLLNCEQMLKGDISDPLEREIFIKYLFKAVLASGDAQLAARGEYHPSYPAKRELLRAIDGIDSLLEQYDMALDARFHPDYSKLIDRDIVAWHEQVVDIWLTTLKKLEEARLGQAIGSWQAYASPSVSKGQSGSGLIALLRNLAVNVRDAGPGVVLSNIRWSMIYPRERVISVLPLLLQNKSGKVEACVKQALDLSNGDMPHAIERYKTLWSKYA